ncbi:NAD(P)/FAD-dependent oxidoreductase [Salmonella enterica]|nr:NAD(P)/FAD-dependent oxidoreductase [Salmonella enterica]
MKNDTHVYQKYEQERIKRQRADGNEQYQRIEGEFSDFNNAPWIKQPVQRDAKNIHVQTLIVGGGLGGVLVAINLVKKGLRDFIILENGADFGGVWYWNRYPGCSCDIESYIYLPLLEETGYVPTEKYITANEISNYIRNLCEKYGLYDHVYFQNSLTESLWNEEQGFWMSHSSMGDNISSKYVILSTGFLSVPKLPGIPGIEKFKGKSFHTSRWDYDYTGGSPEGNLQLLKDKTVALIGTGASAVQCAPWLARDAKQLLVFQRTPVAVGSRRNWNTDRHWFLKQKAGWQQERIQNFNRLMEGNFESVNLVNDEWTDLTAFVDRENKNISEAWELADLRKMEQIRERIDAVVSDEAVAQKLKPWYKWFCKRPCFHESYLNIFNQENVRLIDTSGKGVSQITDSEVIAAGERFPVDCIVYATGFEVGTAYESRCKLTMTGRNGMSLSDKWGDSYSSLHGVMTRDFPNLLIMNVNHSGLAVNFAWMITEQAKHVTYIIDECEKKKVLAVEPYEEAERLWGNEIVKQSEKQSNYHKNCTPSYFNSEGQMNDNSIRKGYYGGGAIQFVSILERWRERGGLDGLELHY